MYPTHRGSFRIATSVAALIGIAASSVLQADARGGGLPRAKIVLKSALSVDAVAGTATLPLFRGTSKGKSVWYIITDSSDAGAAKSRGVVYSPAIAQVSAGCPACVQQVTRSGDAIAFRGAPGFSKTRTYKAGATGFPPTSAAPGAVAESGYSPFIAIAGSPGILNAPIVAVGDGPFDVVHHTNTADRVAGIRATRTGGTVTMVLARGFAGGKPVLYLSTEASDPGAATVERAVYVPVLAKAGAASKVPIVVFANGMRGRGNPQAQGLQYVALDTPLGADASAANAASIGSPFNILATFPNVNDPAAPSGYSPLWDVQVAAWSDKAVAAQKNVRQTDFAAMADLVQSHMITGPGGKAFGPVGFVVNCPVVAYTDGKP